jgi:hypothetical protein
MWLLFGLTIFCIVLYSSGQATTKEKNNTGSNYTSESAGYVPYFWMEEGRFHEWD